jgi:histidine ammonia-lyase
VPQVHGAVRDAVAQAARVLEIELNAVTDNPLVFPEAADAPLDRQVISAGHFHGMPLALAMSYVKAAIPVLASISERRLNKLVDPATSDGLPGFLVGNEDGTESGFMIVQYTAAAIVNDLASRAMPATVYSIPTSANAEDHVSMGANEARHVLAMADDLGKVLALELVTAAQALDLRVRMVEGEAHPGRAVSAAHEAIRARIAFLEHDRALDGDVRAALALVEEGAVLAAARAVVP